MVKERRTVLNQYYDILRAVKRERESIDEKMHYTFKLTHVQLMVGMAYDKVKKRVLELEQRKLLTMKPLQVTEHGDKFIAEYALIVRSQNRLKNGIMDPSLDKIKAAQPVTVQDKQIDMQQVINAQNAIIGELEKHQN